MSGENRDALLNQIAAMQDVIDAPDADVAAIVLSGKGTISQRALGPKDMPERERSIAEQYRLKAIEYVKAAREAWLLEDLKTSTLEMHKISYMTGKEKITDAAAERVVKSSDAWRYHVTGIVDAKARAEGLRQELEAIRLHEREIDRRAWNARVERNMGRSVT